MIIVGFISIMARTLDFTHTEALLTFNGAQTATPFFNMIFNLSSGSYDLRLGFKNEQNLFSQVISCNTILLHGITA